MAVNLDLLSDSDYQKYSEGRFDEMSIAAQKYIADGFTTGEVLGEQAKRAASSTVRAIADFASEYIPGITVDKEADLEQERTSRMMLETDPGTSMGGLILGSVADPITLPAAFLAPIRVGGAITTGAARGAVAGAAYGAIEPVYEEFEDSRLMNIGVGTAFGAALGTGGGALAKLFKHGEVKIVEAGDDVTPPKVEVAGKEGYPDSNGNLIDEQGTVVLSAQEMEAKALKDIGEPAGEYRWNPQTSRVEVMEVTQPDISFDLPTTIKSDIKFNKVPVEFNNGLDEALWNIQRAPGRQRTQAYYEWVNQRTGLDDAQIKALAREVSVDLARQVAKTPEVNGKLVLPSTKASSSIITQKTKPRVRPVEYQPKGVTKKTYFTEADLGVLNRLGLKVVQRSPNQISFQDTLNKNKLLSTAEAAARLRALGWELDLSGMRKPKAAKVTKAAETAEAPVQPAEAPVQAADEVPMQPATRAPEDIGVPRELGSVGARGVRPEKQFGPELMPETAARVGRTGRGGISQEEFLLRNLMEGDVRNVVVPKDVITQSGASLRGLMQTGAAELRKILDEHGNMANFIVQKKGDPRAMSGNEAAAFKWFYADAMKKRDDILEQLAGSYRAGESLDTPQAARWAEDLMYYSGVDLFWKNEGTKASRALNARKLIAQQIAKNSKIKGLFPEIGC